MLQSRGKTQPSRGRVEAARLLLRNVTCKREFMSHRSVILRYTALAATRRMAIRLEFQPLQCRPPDGLPWGSRSPDAYRMKSTTCRLLTFWTLHPEAGLAGGCNVAPRPSTIQVSPDGMVASMVAVVSVSIRWMVFMASSRLLPADSAQKHGTCRGAACLPLNPCYQQSRPRDRAPCAALAVLTGSFTPWTCPVQAATANCS